ALAQLGDGSILLLLADAYTERQPDGSYKNLFAANNAVNCSDYTIPTDLAYYDGLVEKYKKLAPRLGVASAYNDLSCALWPVHATQDPGPISADGAPPILVVGTTDWWRSRAATASASSPSASALQWSRASTRCWRATTSRWCSSGRRPRHTATRSSPPRGPASTSSPKSRSLRPCRRSTP